MIFVVADHGGYAVKQRLITWLRGQGFSVTDLGPTKLKPSDDYPQQARLLARAIQRQPGSRGIAICRSGVGMAMAANKFSGIRAAQVFSPLMAKKSRLDEDANI